MIYIFDKKQAIIKVLTNDDFTAAHLNFKINTATTFEFSLPASKALPSGSKYVATPHPLNDSKFIMLRLTERVDNTETIDYSAYELAYQELATDGYIEDKRPQNQSALNLMKIALNGSNWELNNVNVSGTATTNFYYVDRLSAISKVVDLLGGEIVFYIEIQGNAISGRYMDYLARQGADTSKVFASGSNLLTVERQSDTSNIYTAILPRGKGEEIDNGEADTPDGYGRRINIADVEWKKSAGNPLDKPKGSIVLSDPDATSEWGQINGNARLLLQTYDDIDDVNVLINSAYKTLQSVNHPQIQYSATVADVGGLSLGDTVLIMHGDRDLSYKTRVFEVKYDLLSPDQTELSLGDDLSSNSITSQLNSLSTVADTTSSQTQWTINQIGRPSTTFGNTEPANPKVGDVFFKELPDGGTEIYRWNGDIWELLASPTTADDISTAVDDAVAQANAHTATAIEQNNASQQEVMNDIAKSQADLAIKDGDFNNKAQAMADKALSDAKANTATVAQDTLNSANQNIASAKSDINDTINALSVGGSNYILNSSGMNASSTTRPVLRGTISDVSLATITYDSDAITLTNPTSNTSSEWYYQLVTAWQDITKTPLIAGSQYTLAVDVMGTAKQVALRWGSKEAAPYQGIKAFDINNTSWTRVVFTFTMPVGTLTTYLRIQGAINNQYASGFTGGETLRFRYVKLEYGNKPTDWTNAPEDVVLDYTTKDNKIKETITQYQETNDGLVSKAQTDATTALGLVETKISLTDYNTKTGELSKAINDTKDTADSSAQTIADIQEADGKRDYRISEVEKTAGKITSTVSDISTAQGEQSGYISTLQQSAQEFVGTIRDINNVVNDLQQINQINNSEFTPDFSGWHSGSDQAIADETSNVPAGWYRANGRYQSSTAVGNVLSAGINSIHTDLIPVGQGVVITGSAVGYSSSDYNGTVTLAVDFAYYDSSKKLISNNRTHSSILTDWTRITLKDTTPINTAYVSFGIVTNGNVGTNYYSQPLLVFADVLGNYVRGSYNNNAALAQVKITADGVSSIVSDPTTGLSTRVQTAEGTLNTVKSTADGAMSKASQTANDITQEIKERDKGDLLVY